MLTAPDTGNLLFLTLFLRFVSENVTRCSQLSFFQQNVTLVECLKSLLCGIITLLLNTGAGQELPHLAVTTSISKLKLPGPELEKT